MKSKLLLWIDGPLYFSIAYNLQKMYDCDIYAIIDVTNKPKNFYIDQKIVKFKKIWFFHDNISKFHTPNLDYLSTFEKKYDINIWKIAINERLFYNFYNFHKFSSDQILSIEEDSCKLFENVLDEIQPDNILTYTPNFHHSELFYQLVKAKNLPILILSNPMIGYKSRISENREILDSYEKNADPYLRNRIEHAQIIHPLDIPRFQNLSVIPVMQATHCTSDMYWADERLGKERLTRAYPWRSLIESGVYVPGGSDAPVEFPNPLEGIYAATTRQDKHKWPENGWQPKERMTLDMAIKSYTEWPSYASFEENSKGKIEEGFYADFTVLDKPMKKDNIDMILKTKVTFTIVNGEVVYKK